MSDKMKVKFLTAIWGARYIEEFASVSLPSYLAEGNLPSLAAGTDLGIVILTSTESRQKFDELPIFQRLSALCPVKYIFIDDLITSGNYGVTLTLAYARGIRDSGEAQTDTTFVFMNSDFVLADGSMRSLMAKLSEGHRCVMAPSLRACAETVVPTLAGLVDSEHGVLRIAPRSLVQLAFDNLHPTVIGKTITQNLITCETHNQIYWQVDDNTLLGRYHLIFMLAIRPEVPMGYINSYCDYGFVPELVPSGEFCVFENSDDFFMLEIQSAAQERSMLACGSSEISKIAAELARWTTREHRRFAEKDVVFHTGGLPERLAFVRRQAAGLIENLHRRMGASLNHANHFYWVSGVAAWSSLKFSDEQGALPPEVDSAQTFQRTDPRSGSEPGLTSHIRRRLTEIFGFWLGSYARVLSQINRKTGTVPNAPIWHHLWLDSQLIRRWAAREGARGRAILLVSREDGPFRSALSALVPIRAHMHFQDLVSEAEERVRTGQDQPGGPRFNTVFLHLERVDVLEFQALFEAGQVLLAPGGEMIVFLEHKLSGGDSSNFSVELAQYAERLLPSAWLGYRLTASFAGGHTKRRLRLAERSLFRYFIPSSIAKLPSCVLAIACWPLLAFATVLNNLRLRNTFSQCSDYCSSALLVFRRLDDFDSSKRAGKTQLNADIAEEPHFSSQISTPSETAAIVQDTAPPIDGGATKGTPMMGGRR
ncbi:hypothetical protein [Bradyrhizobium liaoningense]|uniref:hypothetical protein n=1 Tax=Bradyrhizobium liaoningense TaxID=43992 RepID=UPI001BA4479F|nr:hypothetical protein [Bradyrhizobium liaoningense]MBR0856667.1 hypothetical protein [Bradyrhizobium liaoningense]